MAMNMGYAPREARTVPEQEQCPACLQLYSYELEYRCGLCDEPTCPVCVVRIEEQWVCPDCAEGI